MPTKESTIIRFDEVSFEHSATKPILHEVSFTIRRRQKIALMGQNGAGKSTLFNLLMNTLNPTEGKINRPDDVSIALARQVISRSELDITVQEFFAKCFTKKIYDLDPKIDAVLEVVNLQANKDKLIKNFSGGQKARLLLASALIQDPDLLLLDEPTNNLDAEGIARLTEFLINYDKTVIVISHDAEFLNAFTEGVLYLDIFTKQVEKYTGNYKDVVREITQRVAKEQRQNAQFERHIQAKKDKANYFANKGGRMRILAKRMRESAAEAEESKIDVRREDKTIRRFNIEALNRPAGQIISFKSLSVIKDYKPVRCQAEISLRRDEHLALIGPNGIGKSTLLEHLANRTDPEVTIAEGVKIGYYRQDFSTLDFDQTVFQSLASVMDPVDEEILRATAAAFLLTGNQVYSKVGDLSEGQKGLVAFAQLTLQKPNLLILDEPTNHINFRHLPVIAKALDKYEGAMILVSHVPDFVRQIRIDQTLDLGKLKPLK